MAGRRAHLYPVLNTAVVIGNVPICGCAAGNRFASLYVPVVRSAVATTLVGSNQATCNGTACGGYVFASSAAHLMTQYTADNCTEDSTTDVGVATTIARNLLALYPAALLGRAHDSAHGGHGRFVHSFIGTLAIFIRCLR